MSAERYSYRVFADDVDETVRIQPPYPSWSSMFFGIALVVRNILEDEKHGIRGVPVDPPIRWYLEIPCTELCRDDPGELISHEVVQGVCKEARKIMTEMLEECMGGAIPSSTRRDIANDFGIRVYWMLCDARYALCRKLPVIVELTVFSALPVTSRLRSMMPIAMEGLELSQLAAAGSGSAEDEMCAICLAEFHAESVVTRLPCSHYFHGECILRWLRIKWSCPLCRFVPPH